jgi:hypothetical protein
MLRATNRRSGATVGSRTIAGEWALRPAGYGPGGTASPNGVFVVLTGSSYAYTDASGIWTAKTSLAVVDTAFKGDPRTIELEGRYMPESISNDGRSLYLLESPVSPAPVPPRLRVFDLGTRTFADLGGDPLPDAGAFRAARIAIGDSKLEIWAGRQPTLVRIDLGARVAHVTPLPADQRDEGEQALMWSALLSGDRRTAYLVNAAIGVIDEVDTTSLAVLRTARLNPSTSELSPVQAVLDALHPVALAKRGVGVNGAVFSPEGASIYAIGESGIWSIDARSLKGRQLTKDGTYVSLGMSPDGVRIYALGFDDGIVRVIATRDGSLLGIMPKIAWPSEIVSVDAG